MNRNVNRALIIGGVAVAILVLLPLVLGLFSGGQGYGYGGMMGPGMMGGYGWGWFMPIIMILFWGLIIWAIVELVRGTTGYRSGDPSGRSDTALDVLKKRYARGEISKEEFEDKKKDIV